MSDNWNLNISQATLALHRDWFLSVTPEDSDFYARIRSGLQNDGGKDDFGMRVPGVSCAHCMKVFRLAMDIVKPKRILEIGFNLGYSCRTFLELGVTFITSIEKRNSSEVVKSAELILDEYGASRVEIIVGSTLREMMPDLGSRDDQFDMAFVDGSHDLPDIVEDIKCCKLLNIPHLLMDDFWPHFGRTQEAIEATGIKPTAILGNFVICDATI